MGSRTLVLGFALVLAACSGGGSAQRQVPDTGSSANANSTVPKSIAHEHLVAVAPMAV